MRKLEREGVRFSLAGNRARVPTEQEMRLVRQLLWTLYGLPMPCYRKEGREERTAKHK